VDALGVLEKTACCTKPVGEPECAALAVQLVLNEKWCIRTFGESPPQPNLIRSS